METKLMKNRNLFTLSKVIASVSLFVCGSVNANIDFHFIHKRSVGDCSNNFAVYANILAEKTNGAHSAESCFKGNCEILAGNEVWDKTRGGMFASDPSGEYKIHAVCSAYKWNSKAFKQGSESQQIIAVPNDNSSVAIEVTCPISELENVAILQPPQIVVTVYK
jgi:hypothetical protein